MRVHRLCLESIGLTTYLPCSTLKRIRLVDHTIWAVPFVSRVPNLSVLWSHAAHMDKLHVTHAAPSRTSLVRPREFCSSLSTASDEVGHIDFTVATYASVVENFILTTPLHSFDNV